ncbi:APC family permease [Riemerella columbina]|uniref:APC family permease n=1 Tax=Riemerella columbina TaxID=103810 RepID=UPI00266FAF5B|nr:amino acid permease [Riemerella columbina]WKS94458.1 amino acid permease [Riemerella columbina]
MSSIWKKKPLAAYEADMKKSELKRVLGKWSLTAIGIGAIIGGGIFVLTGTGAYYHAGPALALSFVVAGIACIFAALCYAEFASLLPVEGSAYAYAYGTVGEIFAWLIGWGLVLEYAMGSMTVAVSWSGYFNKLLKMMGVEIPYYLTNDIASARDYALNQGLEVPSFAFNLPAFCIVLLVTALLVRGTKEAAGANNFIVLLKTSVVIFVIIVGTFYINMDNLTPFIPEETMIKQSNGSMGPAYGIQGIIAGASAVFFAYIGFDAVSTQAAEAKNPKKDIPFAIIASLLVCTLLYILMSLVLTGMMNYKDFGSVPDALTAPVAIAFEKATGMNWAVILITVSATIGLISVLMVLMLGQTRIFLGMAKDGLLPKIFKDIHPVRKTPYKNTLLLGVVVALVAASTPISTLVHMTSFGTLFAFTMVCFAVWLLRVKRPDLKRDFRTPALPLIALLGIITNLYLIFNLETSAIYMAIGWLTFGILVYFLYGKKNSVLNKGGYDEYQ